MSKDKTVVSSKESGAHHFKDKGHLKSDKKEGAHDPGKHESPLKVEGAFERKDKPQVHAESDTMHNGRQHPSATKLADSKILGGKLRLSDEK
jgi:hypothetical protein